MARVIAIYIAESWQDSYDCCCIRRPDSQNPAPFSFQLSSTKFEGAKIMAKPATPKSDMPQIHEMENGDTYTEKVSVDENGVPLDPETRRLEKKLKLKLDFIILPLISMVYFFAQMGKSDLGNAEIAGMAKELHLTAKQYSNAASTFLVGYIVFQLPGTLLLRKIGPNWQFGGAMLSWGLFTTLSVFVKNAPTLLAIRFLIGGAEAFVQGAVFYLSFWYTYGELATRGSIFFSCSSLASAFNGLIAYAIVKDLNGAHGWLAWKWLFLIEGIIPIATSFIVIIFVPPTPETARFGFSAEEKLLAASRGARAHNDPEAKIEWKKIPASLLEVHFWLMTIMACAGHFCLSSFSNFLPIIIVGFGYDIVHSQLMSVVVFACAFVGIIFWARVADMTNARGLTLAASSFVTVLGYALLIGLTGTKGRLAATCIVAFGSYPNTVLVLSWLSMSVVGYTKRGSSLAFINIFSQILAIAGNQAYKDPPYYRTGNAASLSLAALCGIVALITSFYFKYRNNRKREVQFSEQSNALRLLSIQDLGNNHPGT